MSDQNKLELPVMSSSINLTRSFMGITDSNVTDIEVASMRDAVHRVYAIMRRKWGVAPTTLAISVGWWEKLHDFFTEKLGLAYSDKAPVTFGKPYSTSFNLGWMPSSTDPCALGVREAGKDMSKKLPDVNIAKMLQDIESEEDLSKLPDIDIAALMADLEIIPNDSDDVDEDEEYVVSFDAFADVEAEWRSYSFKALPNGSLVVNEQEILFAWLYGKMNKKGRMKKPRLAVIWNDQPRMVYTWPVYVDTIHNILVGDFDMSLGQYVADNLAIGEETDYKSYKYDEFASKMRKYDIDITK